MTTLNDDVGYGSSKEVTKRFKEKDTIINIILCVL